MYVAIGPDNLEEYITHGFTEPGDKTPPLPDLAVPMMRTPFEDAVLTLPDSPEAETVSDIGDLPDRLEAMIKDELNFVLQKTL